MGAASQRSALTPPGTWSCPILMLRPFSLSFSCFLTLNFEHPGPSIFLLSLSNLFCLLGQYFIHIADIFFPFQCKICVSCTPYHGIIYLQKLPLGFICINSLIKVCRQSRNTFLLLYCLFFLPPWGRRGFKPRIRPPYPQRVVKGD